MAHSLEQSTSSAVSPSLDYVNAILMEEAMDAGTPVQQVSNASYMAILSGFYEILGQHVPPNIIGRHAGVFDPHFLHAKGASAKVGLIDGRHNKAWTSAVSVPANGHPLSNSQHESPLTSTDITQVHENENGRYNSCCRLNSTRVREAVAAQTYDGVLKSNNGVLVDAMVSLRADGPKGHMRQEQGNRRSQLPSAIGQFSWKLAKIELSLEHLKLNELYTSLYTEDQPVCSSAGAGAATDSAHKISLPRSKGCKICQTDRSQVFVFVDVREILVSCAQAVAIGDAKRATEILHELCQVHGASAKGTALQRTAHLFSKALAARLTGTGQREFKALSLSLPLAGGYPFAAALKVGFELSPYDKIPQFFANQSILKAAEGASRLHVVDYGSKHGSMQWPCLINALADRKGGPPFLVVTTVEFPQPGLNVADRLNRSGQQLAACAKAYRVPFHYHAVVTNSWEEVNAASLHCNESEVLVLNCMSCLRHVPDDTTSMGSDDTTDIAVTISPRQKLLACMHALNPQLLVTAVVNVAGNSLFFVSRFREVLYSSSNMLDMFDTLLDDGTQRLTVESGSLYCDILNAVACEGAERLERCETYKQWHARITNAGFEQLPIPSTILSRSKSHVRQHYHKDFLMDDDGKGWLFVGWKGRPVLATSAWKPCLV